ncbi:hypothetical protein ACA910_014909 [Epithemia clementina (nom. ined.)]
MVVHKPIRRQLFLFLVELFLLEVSVPLAECRLLGGGDDAVDGDANNNGADDGSGGDDNNDNNRDWEGRTGAGRGWGYYYYYSDDGEYDYYDERDEKAVKKMLFAYLSFLIFGLSVYFGMARYRRMKNQERYNKGYTMAKGIVEQSTQEYSATVSDGNKEALYPKTGTYRGKYFEHGRYLRSTTELHFEPLENHRGWTISGHGQDGDGPFIITEGLVSQNSSAMNNSSGGGIVTEVPGQSMNAYWVETPDHSNSSSKNNRVVLNTGTFDFGGDNKFTGGWLANDGTEGCYHGFKIKATLTKKKLVAGGGIGLYTALDDTGAVQPSSKVVELELASTGKNKNNNIL